jgi:hypothetical protein
VAYRFATYEKRDRVAYVTLNNDSERWAAEILECSPVSVRLTEV